MQIRNKFLLNNILKNCMSRIIDRLINLFGKLIFNYKHISHLLIVFLSHASTKKKKREIEIIELTFRR